MTSPLEEHAQFEALDRYLSELHAGRAADRAQLLCRYPELASALECLEALERIAPPSTDRADAAANTVLENPAESAPKDFGAYELLEEIGRGGMGVVYKARQKGLDRLVALKMILGSFLASPEHVRRFQIEAKAAAGLRHPSIVQIHDVGQHHGQHYFAMEYVEGQSLAQRLAQAALGVRDAARLMEKVARAVAHLHRHGVVHRDLKPSNILMDQEGLPYVTDFGLAKVLAPNSEMTATGVIAGTPSYMSPEQAAGHSSRVGPASDVYSLGAILYELLSGRPPFKQENPLDTLVEVLDVDPTPPSRINPRVPRDLELIAMKCLAKSPGERYATADDLADDLEHYLKEEDICARPPSLVRRLWCWTRREPALALRLAALAVFYLVDLVNFGLRNIDAAFHEKMSILVVIWAASSIVCQQGLRNARWSVPARFLWGTLDSAILLAVLLVADGLMSPLVLGYPLLIIGAGLWFRVRFVWYMTALSLASYGVLIYDFHVRRPELQQRFAITLDRHVIVLVALLVAAGTVSYLVQRVRALSSYYGQKL